MINFTDFKKVFIWIFIGSIVVAALTAVATVLFGSFSAISGRVFATLFAMVFHSLICLLFIWDEDRRKEFDRLPIFLNTLFFLVICSFIGWMFRIWEIITPTTLGHLYTTYFYVAFAALHTEMLSRALKLKNYIDTIIYANMLFIGIVVLMLQPVVYFRANLTDIYFRLLAAATIIDGTLTILTMIFYKLFFYQNPQAQMAGDGSGQTVPAREGSAGSFLGMLVVCIISLAILFFWVLGMMY